MLQTVWLALFAAAFIAALALFVLQPILPEGRRSTKLIGMVNVLLWPTVAFGAQNIEVPAESGGIAVTQGSFAVVLFATAMFAFSVIALALAPFGAFPPSADDGAEGDTDELRRQREAQSNV